jgi:hypothetical protein
VAWAETLSAGQLRDQGMRIPGSTGSVAT